MLARHGPIFRPKNGRSDPGWDHRVLPLHPAYTPVISLTTLQPHQREEITYSTDSDSVAMDADLKTRSQTCQGHEATSRLPSHHFLSDDLCARSSASRNDSIFPHGGPEAGPDPLGAVDRLPRAVCILFFVGWVHIMPCINVSQVYQVSCISKYGMYSSAALS